MPTRCRRRPKTALYCIHAVIIIARDFILRHAFNTTPNPDTLALAAAGGSIFGPALAIRACVLILRRLATLGLRRRLVATLADGPRRFPRRGLDGLRLLLLAESCARRIGAVGLASSRRGWGGQGGRSGEGGGGNSHDSPASADSSGGRRSSNSSSRIAFSTSCAVIVVRRPSFARSLALRRRQAQGRRERELTQSRACMRVWNEG